MDQAGVSEGWIHGNLACLSVEFSGHFDILAWVSFCDILSGNWYIFWHNSTEVEVSKFWHPDGIRGNLAYLLCNIR